MLRVKTIQLVDTRPALNRLIRKPLLVRDWRFNLLHTANLIGADLHDSPTAVSQKKILLATLLIDDHVERTIAVSQFGNRFSHDLGAWFQGIYRKLYQRRAGVSGQQAWLVGHGERYEGAHWCAGFKSPMGAVVDFDISPIDDGLERKRNGS